MADPAAIRFNNPGAMWPGPSSKLFGATNYTTLNDGQNNRIAQFPDAESGAAAQFDLLRRGYTGMTLADAIKKWSGGNHSQPYVAHIAKSTGLAPTTVLTPELLSDATKAVPFAKAMAQWEAGRPYPMTDDQWNAAHARFLGGPQSPPSSAPTTTGSIQGRSMPQDPVTGAWTPEEVIKSRYGTANQFWDTRRASTPIGAIAEGLGGFFGMREKGAADDLVRQNQAVQQEALRRAASAGSTADLARTMIASGIPQLGEQGVSILGRNLSAEDARNTPDAKLARERAEFQFREEQAAAPYRREKLEAEVRALKTKDDVDAFVGRILNGGQQPAPSQPTAPGVKPMSGDVVQGDPNLIRVQDAQPQPPTASPKPQGLEEIIRSRPLAEQQAWGLMWKTDKKEAMKMLQEWSAPKLNKTTEHDLDKGLMGAINSTSRLQEVQRQFKPEFLQGGSQATINFNTFRDKFLTGKLKPNPQELAQLNQYHTWRASAWNELNSYIKELAGSAVTGNELERTLRERPNPGTGWVDGDSPASYEAKLNSTLRNGKMAIARYRYLRQNGLLKEGEAMAKREDLGQQFPIEQMPKIIDQEGEKTLKRMRMENPGKSDQELLPKAMEEVSKRFGLAI